MCPFGAPTFEDQPSRLFAVVDVRDALCFDPVAVEASSKVMVEPSKKTQSPFSPGETLYTVVS